MLCVQKRVFSKIKTNEKFSLVFYNANKFYQRAKALFFMQKNRKNRPFSRLSTAPFCFVDNYGFCG